MARFYGRAMPKLRFSSIASNARPCPVPFKDIKSIPVTTFPADPKLVAGEFSELLALQMCRDDPNELVSPYDARYLQPPPGMTFPDDYDRSYRCPISPLLQLRPQPIGAVYNFARGDASFPIIFTGRELARYFENETPGLAHRQALNVLARDTQWSPPRTAWVWAILDVTLFSALSAAWYVKWLKGTGYSFRERPAEGGDQDPSRPALRLTMRTDLTPARSARRGPSLAARTPAPRWPAPSH